MTADRSCRVKRSCTPGPQRPNSLDANGKVKWEQLRTPMPDTPDAVAQYMADVGVVEWAPGDEFWVSFIERFCEPDTSPYAQNGKIPFDDPDYKLDRRLARSTQYDGHMDEALLSQFAQRTWDAQASIVDLGCRNGVRTCGYARLHPHAAVVGIDSDPGNVACARQLAARLELSNVEFYCADPLDLPAEFAERTFDIATSTSVAEYIGDARGKSARSIDEALSRPVDPYFAAYALTLVRLLPDGGTLLSLEEIIDPVVFALWYRALHEAGIAVNWDETTFLSFPDGEVDCTMAYPLIVGVKGTDELMKPDELRQWWWRSGPEADQLQTLSDAAAEAAFRALDAPTFVKGFFWSDDEVYEHVEIWQAGPLALEYSYSSPLDPDYGPRRLAFGAADQIGEMVALADPRSHGANPHSVTVYDSPEDAYQGPRRLTAPIVA